MNALEPTELHEATQICNKIFGRLNEAEQLKQQRMNFSQGIVYSGDKATRNAKHKHMMFGGLNKYFFIVMIVCIILGYFIDIELLNTVGGLCLVLILIGTIVNTVSRKKGLFKQSDREVELIEEARKMYSDNSYVISKIPNEYFYPQAMEYLEKIFAQGRVDNMNDAYDKLDEQIHRWKMESTQEQILQNQMYEMQILREIEWRQIWFS